MKSFMYKGAFLLLLLVGTSLAENQVSIDALVDSVIASAREIIKIGGLDEHTLPDIDETFQKKVGFVKVKGTFKGTNGWAGYLSSISRKGNAHLSYGPAGASLSVALGLDRLEAGYKYKARFAKVGPNGHISAQVSSNSIRLQAGVVKEGSQCKVSVQSLVLEDLGKLKIKASGLGPLNWLLSRILTWVTNKSRDKMRENIDKNLRKALEKVGEKRFNCDGLDLSGL